MQHISFFLFFFFFLFNYLEVKCHLDLFLGDLPIMNGDQKTYYVYIIVYTAVTAEVCDVINGLKV